MKTRLELMTIKTALEEHTADRDEVLGLIMSMIEENQIYDIDELHQVNEFCALQLTEQEIDNLFN